MLSNFKQLKFHVFATTRLFRAYGVSWILALITYLNLFPFSNLVVLTSMVMVYGGFIGCLVRLMYVRIPSLNDDTSCSSRNQLLTFIEMRFMWKFETTQDFIDMWRLLMVCGAARTSRLAISYPHCLQIRCPYVNGYGLWLVYRLLGAVKLMYVRIPFLTD